ncbi:hypothetical protein Tco_1129865, partial [Tanacetum coccineum]
SKLKDDGMQDFKDCVGSLDRIIGYSHFVTSFPASFAMFMPYLTSDHCPTILTILDVIIRKPKAFRFMNFLADKIEFLGVVRDNRETEVKGFEMYKLAMKLKGMKKHMRNLNRKNGTNDHVYAVEDASSLFLRKLDVEQAIELIKPVTNEEIKSVNGKDTCSAVKEFFISGKLFGELVDYNQSAFIPSRQISENILSALEFMKGKLKITSQCFADDMLMLCHGDMVLLSILKRGLDEFSLAFGLYPRITKSEAFFCGHTPEVKAKTMFAMPFSEVYWRSLFILPKLVCDTIDKLVKKFLWTKGDNAIGMVSVGWKEVCKTKSQEGLGLRPLHDWNEALMAKHLWNIACDKN